MFSVDAGGSAEVSSDIIIIIITLETLELHRANAPREVVILSLSEARSHNEGSLQTAWIDSFDIEKRKICKRMITQIQ